MSSDREKIAARLRELVEAVNLVAADAEKLGLKVRMVAGSPGRVDYGEGSRVAVTRIWLDQKPLEF